MRGAFKLLLIFLGFGLNFIAENSTYSVPIPFDWTSNLEPTTPIDPVSVIEEIIHAPAYWGIETIGADLVKDEVASMKLKPVSVVVSDGGVSLTEKKVSYVRPRRKTLLELLFHTGVGKALDEITTEEERRDNWQEFMEEAYSYLAPAIAASNPVHGDSVSSVIGAVEGKSGVSNTVEIEDLNVFDGSSVAIFSHLAAAYKALANRPEPTPILNMSHGLGASRPVTESLQELLQKKDSICVVAADNRSIELSESLVISKIDDCVVTGALGLSGIRSDFSDYGKPVKLIAPGENIASLKKNAQTGALDLSIVSGTSFSGPMVSGSAATLKALLPFATSAQIRELLYKSAIDIGLEGRDDSSGYGLLNTIKATRIAIKLVKANVQSSNELSLALKDPKTFDLSDLSRQAFIAATKVGGTSADYPRLLRESILLDGHVESFSQLAKFHEKSKFGAYALGLKILALNRPFVKIEKEDLTQMAEHLAKLQEDAIKERSWNYYVIQSMANADLLLEVRNHLSDMNKALTASLAENQMKLIKRMPPNESFQQRPFDSSSNAPAATLKTE